MKNLELFQANITKLVEKAHGELTKPKQRIGFMEGKFEVPDDLDTMFAEEIRAMFEDGPLFPEDTLADKSE